MKWGRTQACARRASSVSEVARRFAEFLTTDLKARPLLRIRYGADNTDGKPGQPARENVRSCFASLTDTDARWRFVSEDLLALRNLPEAEECFDQLPPRGTQPCRENA